MEVQILYSEDWFSSFSVVLLMFWPYMYVSDIHRTLRVRISGKKNVTLNILLHMLVLTH